MKYLPRSVLTAVKMTGPRIKASKPLTWNPGARMEANQKHKPLTTSEKAPNVKMFAGRDRTDKIGFIKALTAPMATAAIIAAGKFAKSTPLKMMSTTNKLSAVASNVKNVPNMVSPVFAF